jgi:hypothetical protein
MNLRCHKSAIPRYGVRPGPTDPFSPLLFAAPLRFLAPLSHDGQASFSYTRHRFSIQPPWR